MASDLAPGSELAGYRIEAFVARGGMGLVYRATQLSLDRPVALKVLAPELASEDSFRKRFLREARLAAALEHPHVLPVYEAGEAEGRLFLALRYVDAEDLGRILGRGPLPPERARTIVGQVASALDAAHALGLLHRDVKPENVLLVGEHGYLTDFGLARPLSERGLTKTGEILGSVDYLAPEQIERGHSDERSDVYALGCLLYACLTGKPPFRREHEAATMWAHLNEPPPTGTPFDAVLGRALAKDPDRRFGSAGELAAALAFTPAPTFLSTPKSALPRPTTVFLGRERELREVGELLAGEQTRLLTLTGSGGTGKTRLAIEAAARVSDRFPDGVAWVGLSALRDPTLVGASVAQALEVPEQPGTSPLDSIVRTLESRRALLLLDNCEHVIDPVAELASTLVERCPLLTLAATSRERLGLRPERVFAVPPMEAQDSQALFVERARAVESGFEGDEHVAAICDAVDGLPLAVELAAARVRSLSTEAIRERLDQRLSLLTTRDRDVDERQRTLEATIAWSYDLLHVEEQAALRALSLFAGGCTLDAARDVAGADLDLLESLLDKSLLRHRVDAVGRDRYWMLETIREFAARELEHHGETDEAVDSHVAWLLEYLRRTAPRWADPAPRGRIEQVLAEHGNVRVALEGAIARRDADAALEIVGLVGRSWLESGRFIELGARAREALDLGGGKAALEGLALISLGVTAEPAAANEAFVSAAALLRATAMPREAAYATMVHGMWEGEFGSVDRALELLESAVAEFERLGDDYCRSISQSNLDTVASSRTPLEIEEAREFVRRFRAAVDTSRQWGDPGDEIANLDCLGHVLLEAGEVDEAWATAMNGTSLIEESRAGFHCLASLVATLARAAALRGQPEQGLVLGGAVRSALKELGRALPVPRAAALEAAEAACKQELGEESAGRSTAVGETMSADELLEYVRSLEEQG